MSDADTIALSLGDVADELAAAKAAQAEGNRRIVELQNRLNQLNQAIAKQQIVYVTDHALLRYAERVLGLDVEGVRVAIQRSVMPLVVTLGNGRFPIHFAGRVIAIAVVDKGVVKTVLPP